MKATRLERMKEFYSTLKSEIDLPYFADEDHQSADDLREAIEDGSGFDIEIIYYSRAIEYLRDNDASLKESLSIAAELGYTPDNLSSEILASLLASQNARTEFEEITSEIDDFFEELNAEEDEETKPEAN
jgi:hypothetical protein